MGTEQRVVSLSSGLGSAFAASILVDRHGPENVVGVFTDVNGEHPDNYRFLAEVTYALGIRVDKVSNGGRTIWDVMIDQRFLANTRVDICSRVLKREAMLAWLAANHDPANTVVSLGIDWTEEHRFERARTRWAKDGWTIDAPLCEPPYRSKSDAETWLADQGIARPKLYDLGFSHANCGGGCVKAGIAQFTHLLKVDRAWYVGWWEHGEEHVRAHLGKDVAILRDRRGGATKPLTLRALRERIDGGGQLTLDEQSEWGACGCFSGEDDEWKRTGGIPRFLSEPGASRG